MVLGIFKIALRLRDWYVFCDNHTVNIFNTLTLKQIFQKTKTFQETGVPFLVQSFKIKNAIFLYKTALSEANVKTYIEWVVENALITKNGV